MKNKDLKYPYRCGRVKAASKKRIKKVSGRKTMSFSVTRAVFTAFSRFSIIGTSIKLLHVIIHDFFLLQFFRKFNLTKIPIKHVDHELDTKVPFEPQRVGLYMQFIKMWIAPLSMLSKRFGMWNSVPLVREFLIYIRLTYKGAAEVYKQCLTTTNRPDYNDDKLFRLIHRSDPHYCCVPSLHIAIVSLTYAWYRMIFEREDFTKEEKDMWNKDFYNQALAISETVLYIKQHSVNCIPAALYMITYKFPELFSREDAYNFIDNLFLNAPSIKKSDREKIIAHIHSTYTKFSEQGKEAENWTKPIICWLKTYEPYCAK